jgi:hypothetical protein
MVKRIGRRRALAALVAGIRGVSRCDARERGARARGVCGTPRDDHVALPVANVVLEGGRRRF